MKLMGSRGKYYTVTDKSILSEGGEGVVFVDGKTALKVYHDRLTLKSPSMRDKLKRLAGFKHPVAIVPREIVSHKGNPVGFGADYFQHGKPLVSMQSNKMWHLYNVTYKGALQVVMQMHDLVRAAHSANWLLVDPNEYNWLLDPNKFVLRAIDTDSWQNMGYKSSKTKIMPSIQDARMREVATKAADWYALAVVGFQFLTGIHPFRGRVDGYGPRDMLRRAKDGISVFHSGVQVPRSIRSAQNIPRGLRDWYRAVFEDGLREPPPKQLDKIPALVKPSLRTSIGAEGVVSVEKIANLSGVRWFNALWYEKNGMLYHIQHNRRYDLRGVLPSMVAWQDDVPIFVAQEDDVYTFNGNNLIGAKPPLVREWFVADGKLYALTVSTLAYAQVLMFAKPFVNLKQIANISAHTFLQGGVPFFHSLGRMIATVITKTGAFSVVLPKMLGMHIFSMDVCGPFLVVGYDNNGANWNIYIQDGNTQLKLLAEIEQAERDISYAYISGALVCIPQDGVLRVYTRDGQVHSFKHKGVHTGLTLTVYDGKLLARDGDEVFRIRVRK